MLTAVFTAARALCDADDEQLRAFCRAAIAELTAHLKPGVTAEGCGEDFILAAAMLACANCEEEVTSFSAGDVSVRMAAGGRAGSLRRAARGLLAPVLEDDAICFLRVSG